MKFICIFLCICAESVILVQDYVHLLKLAEKKTIGLLAFPPCLVEFSTWANQSINFLCRMLLIRDCISVIVREVFRFSVFSNRRRQWHPTPVLLPGKSHGWRSLVGCVVHGVAKSQTRLSDFLFTFHFHALEKEMATHSSVLAWRIPGMGEPGGLPSTESHRVGHDWSDLAAAAAVF